MKIRWYEILIIALAAIVVFVFAGNWFMTQNSDDVTVSVEQGTVYEAETPSKGIEYNETGSSTIGKIDLNTATSEELCTLPGVGSATAQAIIDYRLQHGGFSDVDELLDVDGIGKSLYDSIKNRVKV